MAKFYVETGEIKTIIVANDMKEAAALGIKREIKRDSEQKVGLLTIVSEVGFVTCDDENMCDFYNDEGHNQDCNYKTEELLNSIGYF